MSVVTVFGGTSINKNRQDVSRGVDILVATPGRMLDLVQQRFLDLRNVEILVLDEADQMLDLGFIHDLRKIVKMLPSKRQSLFFSATMPSAIKDLADKFLTDPAQVSVAPAATTVERVDQYVTFCQQTEKQALLTIMLRAGFSDRGNMDRVLIFTRTKHGADRVVKLLAGNGIAANAIHGNKSQPQRERALAEFKGGKAKILVATDIAARGIDVTGVSHVINFELPNVSEQYVHRIGRTARAGAAGVAIAYCAEDERAYLKGIEKLTKQRIEVVPLPENFIAEANRIKASRTGPVIVEREERPRGPARPAKRYSARPARSGGGGGGGQQRNGGRRRASAYA
jgi:ATP-dependent RNA helicase RhlE